MSEFWKGFTSCIDGRTLGELTGVGLFILIFLSVATTVILSLMRYFNL